MDVVTIDFETYYDKEYSLSKMTTEAYVRDPRFEVIGVGVKVNNYPTDWYSGENPGRFLRSLDYNNKAILCHNTVFDGAILSWHFGIKPKLWLDTLSMARPKHNVEVGGSLKALASYYKLGVKGDEVIHALGKRRADFTAAEMNAYASYCVNDVDLTYQLFNKLKRGFPASELMVIDTTLRMYTEPEIELDDALLRTHLQDVIERKSSLVTQLGLTDATEEEAKSLLMSNDKFADYLRGLGVKPPTKTSPRTGKEAYAFSKTDLAFKALLDHPKERVVSAVEARLGVKSTIEETRTKALIGVAERGRLPIMLNYYGAHTGRFSGGDKMNLQNLPRGGVLRRSLCAPNGKVLVACDSSQIEARMVAWLAGQEDLLESFRQKRDVYSEFASVVFYKPITKADKLERHVGKTAILGLGYGMGYTKFKDTLAAGATGPVVNVSVYNAIEIVRLYRERNSRIAALWRKCGDALHHIVSGNSVSINDKLVVDGEGIHLPNGFLIKYPALQTVPDGAEFFYINNARDFRKYIAAKVTGNGAALNWTKIYGGKVTENIVQALARIVVSEQMAKIARRYKVVLQVHDEVVISCAEHEAEEAKAYMMEVMSMPPTWAPDLPVACEAEIGRNYGECK